MEKFICAIKIIRIPDIRKEFVSRRTLTLAFGNYVQRNKPLSNIISNNSAIILILLVCCHIFKKSNIFLHSYHFIIIQIFLIYQQKKKNLKKKCLDPNEKFLKFKYIERIFIIKNIILFFYLKFYLYKILIF